MDKNCALCDKKIDFSNSSFVVFVDKKEDPHTGKKKRVVKLSHYHCNTERVEQYHDNYTNFMTNYTPHMVFKKIFSCP